MTIEVDGVNYNVYVDEKNLETDKTPVLFVHGFTGSYEDWEFIFDKLPDNFYPAAFDQVGHGKTDCPDDQKFYTSKFKMRAISRICEVLNFREIVLVGYSMGGRAAYNYAVNNPYNLKGLVIESSQPGIEEAIQRIDRIKADNELARKIETEGLSNFIMHWYSQPLFSSIAEMQAEKLGKFYERRLSNNPVGLVNTLKGFSTGRMVSYWEMLPVISSKVLLVTGELDFKFTLLAEKAKPLFLNAEHKIIQGAGHNTHLEKPEEFIKLLKDFLVTLN